MADHKDNAPGVLITFEGGDGAGKTTQVTRLAELLEAHGLEVVRLREPGATPIGEQIRDILLDCGNAEMSARSELLLYEAARSQLVDEVILPALSRGAVVLCDRFYDSTVAYQSYGRGLDPGFVEQANAFACAGVVPDKTVLLVCEDGVDVALERAIEDAGADRIESQGADFHRAVARGFLQLAENDPERIVVVPSQPTKDATQLLVCTALARLWPWLPEAAVVAQEEGR